MLKLIDKILMKKSDEEVNAILKDWNVNDTCQQNAYKDAIPKQYRMIAEASIHYYIDKDELEYELL